MIDGIKPINGVDFPLVEAHAIWIPEKWNTFNPDTHSFSIAEDPNRGETRLDLRIQELENEKVNRFNGDRLAGTYVLYGDLCIGGTTNEERDVSGDFLYSANALINKGFGVGYGGQFMIIASNEEYDIEGYVYSKLPLTIEESVTIEKDLYVRGTTYTNHTETVYVKDNLLILNAAVTENGITPGSVGNTGLILYGRTEDNPISYGLLLNLADGTVRLGKGTLSTNTTDKYSFEYDAGEDLPLALRAEEAVQSITRDDIPLAATYFSDLEFPQWDGKRHCFVSSGYTADTYITKIHNIIKDGETGNGKYSSLLELEKAIVDGVNFDSQKDTRYNIPLLKQYVDNYIEIATDKYFTKSQYETEIQNRIENKEVVSGTGTVSVKIGNNDQMHFANTITGINVTEIAFDGSNNKTENFQLIFQTGDLTNTNFVLTLPSGYEINWAVFAPMFESNKIYHLAFTKFAKTNVLLGNWVVYDK